MSIYLDASILVSIFVRDRHAPRIFEWLSELTAPLLVSSWAVTEFSSALGVRRRMGSMDYSERAASEKSMDNWLAGNIDRIECTAIDLRIARQILRDEAAPLKAPHALHLAMALRSGSILATTDRQLARAAEALGIATNAP